jgi:hypothetical protein
MEISNYEAVESRTSFSAGKLQRRHFLKFTGAFVLTTGVLSCKKDKSLSSKPQINDGSTIDFKDDIGIFNYIYVLEQLEAAFYAKVSAAYPSAFTATQTSFFNDISLHEIAHREFLKNFLVEAGIGNLDFDFSSIDFTNATAVLTAAKTFEDLGVAAYNGVLARAQQSFTLTILSQIVSVEARHAAWVRGQVITNDFADLNALSALGAVDANGLDAALTPDKVLPQLSKYIKTPLKVINF